MPDESSYCSDGTLFTLTEEQLETAAKQYDEQRKAEKEKEAKKQAEETREQNLLRKFAPEEVGEPYSSLRGDN